MGLCGGGGSSDPKPTDAEKAQKYQAGKDWKYYKEVLAPVNQELVDQATDDTHRESAERNASNAAVANQFGASTKKVGDAITQQGGGSGSRMKMALAGLAQDRGGAKAAGEITIDEARRDRNLEKRKQIMAIGREVQGQGIGGINSAASIAHSANIAKSRTDAWEDRMLGEAIGTTAGMIGGAMMAKGGTGAGAKPKPGSGLGDNVVNPTSSNWH